jgi:GNAT superfamily N-acetyltransferase
MTAVAVRSARPEDADQLARLFDQLGHRLAVDDLHARLESLLADPRADVLVADDSGTLVGAATCFLLPVAHEGRTWCRITSLVVDDAHRGHGIGHMLVEAVERSARDAACSRIEATSALHRDGAHRFYKSLGYGRTSVHFLKRLP